MAGISAGYDDFEDAYEIGIKHNLSASAGQYCCVSTSWTGVTVAASRSRRWPYQSASEVDPVSWTG